MFVRNLIHGGRLILRSEDSGGSQVTFLDGDPDDRMATFRCSVGIEESATSNPSVAGVGQLWVRDDSPNTLMFTDDAGNDFTVDLTPA